MKRKTGQRKLLLAAVIIILVILAVIAGLYYLFLVPVQGVPLSPAINQTISPEEVITQQYLYDPARTPEPENRPTNKLILKTVNFDTSGNIASISMYVPASMADSDVYVDGRRIDIIRAQAGTETIFEFDVPENSLNKTLSFAIFKDGNQLAACSLDHIEELIVNGDCIF